jgi:CRISPR type I-E-associated protein CasA/Cse1
MSYNLLEEKWIPVLWKDGRSSRVGIIGALTQAHRIRQIAANNPMDRVAILRFLLVLLYWCKGNPPDDKDSISSFPPGWVQKTQWQQKTVVTFWEVARDSFRTKLQSVAAPERTSGEA